MRRAMSSLVGWWHRCRDLAMVWRAALRVRSPPRLRRWRTVRPELAGTGLTPARAAKAASVRTRPGWDQAVRATAAVTGPMPGWSSRVGHMVLTRARICLRLSAGTGVQVEDANR